MEELERVEGNLGVMNSSVLSVMISQIYQCVNTRQIVYLTTHRLLQANYSSRKQFLKDLTQNQITQDQTEELLTLFWSMKSNISKLSLIVKPGLVQEQKKTENLQSLVQGCGVCVPVGNF